MKATNFAVVWSVALFSKKQNTTRKHESNACCYNFSFITMTSVAQASIAQIRTFQD